ncbi:MAG: hypothetical protein DRG30_03420 [Epsilonproteobacteria bacterium]|nr:MAG: hypothetical protein DRG30_03420 [Campylobacterota bacterium]
MTHLELITFIYEHREELDALYKKKTTAVCETLEKSRLVIKIGDEVELSDTYRQFIDSTLKRIDYGIIFHTYSKELKELLKYKARYQEEEKSYYLDEMYQLIKNIFFKLQKRDEEIQLLLVKIENETSLDLDILIEKAMDILKKITEVNRANNEVRELFFHEIYTVHGKIDYLVDSISTQMIYFVENISSSLNRLNQFIARTRKLRVQNKKLLQLSLMILEEEDEAIDEMLRLSPREYYLTLHRSQKNSIQTFPDGSESSRVIRRLRQSMEFLEVKKEQRKVKIVMPQVENQHLVNMERIELDLAENGTEDIFLFIYEHPELTDFAREGVSGLSLKEESFKIFLQLIIPENPHIELSNTYNNQEIRIARWI